MKIEALASISASFERLCLAAGLEALGEMMEADAQTACGPRHGRGKDRTAHRWGKTKGKIGFHGGKVEIARPRLRSFDGKEQALPSLEGAMTEDWLGKWAMNQMLINVSTRKFERSMRLGVVISKRQVVRLLTAKLETFRAEDEAVLKAGLCGAYVTVDDTGARHAGKNGYTTQIGSYNFTTFRTGNSKSRLAFLSRLCGGVSLYVINDAALAYMEERNLPQIVIGKFKEHKARIFLSAGDWESHLHALGLSAMKVTPDPVLIASEAALWGAIHHQGLLPDTVIVSDDAGQFRVGAHALCWIHAERLVHKLVPANDKQRNAIEIAKRMIWWFYRALKDYKLAPSVQQAQLLRARFDRIFKRASTGYVTLDRLLRRLFRNKDGLLRVLERPEIPINTNSSENDIRAFVTKRKISGGTISDKGRDARDIMLGLAKTCMKLKLSFYEFIGARLGIPGPKTPPLASLIRPAPA